MKMYDKRNTVRLVGDNPFHGISHLSQERARTRSHDVTIPENAAELVKIALKNGANGFMFSASEETLSIVELLSESGVDMSAGLYALVPYAYEYVRIAVKAGGIAGLIRVFARRLLLSRNMKVITMGAMGVLTMDPATLLKTYLTYEISRVKASAKENLHLESMLLHEIITDMSLALKMDWIFRTYIDFMLNFGVKPGFETRNFALLVESFREWGIDFRNVIIAAPFNKVGFQMNPSRKACEQALASLPYPNTIAMSVLASGYIQPTEAFGYVESLSKLAGIVVGVSRERHAQETFRLFKKGSLQNRKSDDDC